MTELMLSESENSTVRDGRAAAWQQISDLDPTSDGWESRLSGMTMVFVDALLAADTDSLETLADPIRDRLAELQGRDEAAREMSGWLKAWLATLRWALQRLPSQDEIALRQQGQAWRFLDALWREQAQTSTDLQCEVDTGESQISRVGRDLRARGLVIQRRAGRTAIWELTPRGRQLVKKLKQEHGEVREVRAARVVTPSRGDHGGPARRRPTRASLDHVMFKDDGPSVSGTVKTKSRRRRPRSGPDVTGVERFVLPADDGGWRVAVAPEGKTVAKADSHKAAIARAKQIVANAGGGHVVPVSRDGKPGRPIGVPRT